MVDNLIYNGGGAVVQYEIQHIDFSDTESIRYMKLKNEDMLMEVYFPKVKITDYYDKDSNTIEDCNVIDWTEFDRLRIQMDHKNIVYLIDSSSSSIS